MSGWLCSRDVGGTPSTRPLDSGAGPGPESQPLFEQLSLQTDRLGKHIKYQSRRNATGNSIILRLSSTEMPCGARHEVTPWTTGQTADSWMY